ncbi:uncharacterized protein FYW49_005264 [Xenentodon cancila]
MDGDLKASLLKYGVKAGPIVASTRPFYERKLRKLLQSDGHDRLNGAEKAGLYSDSEEEDNDGDEEEGENESGAEQEKQKIVEESKQSQKRSREMESRRSVSTCINDESELISSDAVERGSRSDRLDTQIVEKYRPTDQSLYYTPKDSSHKLEMKATAFRL